MKKLLLLLLASFFVATPLLASDLKLRGKVLSADNSEPLIGCKVELLRADSTSVMITLTYENGVFEYPQIKTEENSSYILRFSNMGYVSSFINLTNPTGNLDLGEVQLKASDTELSGIVVESTRIIEQVDRKIVFPSQQDIKSSSNTFDLLQVMQLPGMQTNVFEKTIQINDKPVQFLVDGRPQTRENIASLVPSQILRIEYSDNPSIRYLDKGVGGTINFILKEKMQGFASFIDFMASPLTGFINGNLGASYNEKKSEFTLSYSTNWRDYSERIINADEKFIYPDKVLNRTSWGEPSSFGYLDQTIIVGYTLLISPKTMFSATLNNGIHSRFDRQKTHIIEELKGVTAEKFRFIKTDGDDYIPSLDLFFNHQLTDNQSLEFNLVGTLQRSDLERNLFDNDVLYVANKDENRRRSLIFEGVYKKKFAKIKFDLGLRYLNSHTENKYLNNPTVKLNSDDSFLYSQIAGALGKLSYTLASGLKLQHVNDDSDKRTFVRNMTKLNLFYPLSTIFKLRNNFQLTPVMPSLSQLNDVTLVYDSVWVQKGNPNLKSYNSLSNRLQLSAQKGKFYSELSVNYNRSFNPIYNYKFYDSGSDLFVSQFLNQKYNDKLSVDWRGSANALFNFLRFSLRASWAKYNSSGENYRHKFVNMYWGVDVNTYYKNVSLTGGYSRPTKNLSYETVWTNENNSYLQFVYSKNNLSLKAAAMFFLTSGSKYASVSYSTLNPSKSTILIKDNASMLVLGFSYSFSIGKQLKKGSRQIENTDTEKGVLRL